MAGTMSVLDATGQPSSGSELTFNVTLYNSLLPASNTYYNPTSPLLNGQSFDFDFNHHKQNIFLYDVISSNDKYFVSFENNNDIYRTRKFLLPFTGSFRSYIKVDDKLNSHFNYNYSQGGQSVIEYARLSDLAPINTVNCFGIDTLILQPNAFSLNIGEFNWDFVGNNVLSRFAVPLIEQPENITKQVICKLVSYCDSLKIKGNSTVCIGDVRYSAFLNSECLKNISWLIDTAYASVISTEADSAITLHFKKAGQFYLKALVNNCVVQDSLKIIVATAQTSLQLDKSSNQICPGTTLRLNVNPAMAMYQWQDGSTQPFYDATSAGWYKVTAIDSCGYSFRDSIKLTLIDTTLNFLPKYNICPYDTAYLAIPANITNLNWLPIGSGILRNNQLLLYPLQNTNYQIRGIFDPNCNVQNTVTVQLDNCPEWVRFPSSFTPNNDGLNDQFRPAVSGHLTEYKIRIFDRFGEMLFITSDPYLGWNGKFKGTTQTSGVFVFTATYRFQNGEQKLARGTLVLIR
jgi:gliding motility-associated-like protein